MQGTYEHPFSWQAIGRIVATLLIAVFVWKTFSILVLILVSAMLAAALYPLVTWLHKKLPLVVATFLVVLLLLVPFIILGATVIPTFVREFPDLVVTLNRIINNSPIIPPSVRSIDITQYAQNAGTYLLQSTSIVTNVITSILTLLFLTFYLIFDADRLRALLLSLFPKDKQKKISVVLTQLGQVTGQYIRGNLIISIICGITIFIGLTILQVPYAAPLAIFAALMDLLPLVGSTIGMIPAIIIGLAISPITAVLVAALYLVYQQIESAFLAPTIYNKAINLSPALGFLAVIIGAGLFGITGAFLALPIAASLPAIISYVKNDLQDANEELLATKKRDTKAYARKQSRN